MFSQQVADAICEQLAGGKSLRKAAADSGVSHSTVLYWLDNPEHSEFADQYARARKVGYLLLADEIVDIADEGGTMIRASKHGRAIEGEDTETEVVFDPTAVARNRLRVDTRRWMLSKMLPKVYGERTTIAGDPDAPLNGTIGLSAETARFLADLSNGPGNPGGTPPLPD